MCFTLKFAFSKNSLIDSFVCWETSKGNCYILKADNGRCVILDCGLPFREITGNKLFCGFSKIDFVFCSHCHSDHSKSLKEFKQSGCEIVSYETLPPFTQKHRVHNWELITFPVAHNVMCFGVAIRNKRTNESLCYMTDFCKAPMIEGIDTFIFEVNYIDSLIDEMIDADKDLKHLGFNNHCSLEYAVDYFTRMKTRPKEIYCCHGSQSHSIKKKVYEGMKQFIESGYKNSLEKLFPGLRLSLKLFY